MKMPDVKRMGLSMKQAGIDTRVWAVAGRIVDEDGAVRWDRSIGWVVDIDANGELFGNEIRARVGGQDRYEFRPIDDCGEWIVAIPDGDASSNPVAIARTPNSSTCTVPLTVGNLAVDGTLPLTVVPYDIPFGAFSPFDTEFKNSPHNRREEYGGDYVLTASNISLESDEMRLQSRQASQSYVRGEDFSEAVTSVIETLIPTLIGNLGAPILLPPTWPLVDRLLFKQTLLNALSNVIKGE